jgi:hypothetical protein
MTKAARTNQPSVTPNRRRWLRFKADVPVRVTVKTPAKVKIVDGRGSSLSEGGMGLFAGAELNPGNRVFVEFTPA